MKVLILFLLLTGLFPIGQAYNIQTLNVNVASNIINVVTQYTIFLTRQYDSDGNIAPWNTQLVPAGSNITITFPSVYNTLVGYTCQAPYSSCYVSGKNLIIPNLFPSATALQNITIVVDKVRNPTPAITTDEFMATVGNDQTISSSSPNAIVILSPAFFQSCSITFNPGNVDRNASMIVTATPTNSIPLNGTVVVTFPNAGFWFYDIQMQNFGVNNPMLCANTTSNIMPSMTCLAGLDVNGSKTVTASGIFSTNNTLTFGFSISNILSPPTTYPKDVLYITSQYSGYSIDTCNTTVSGLIPNTISMNITPTTTMVVNQPVLLRFGITLTDIINYYDTFQISFPTGSKLTALSVSGGGGITLTNLKLTNSTTITFGQVSTNKNYPAGSILNITFSNFTAPPSTQITQPIVLTILRDLYSKMIGSGTVQAIMSTLSFTVAATSTLVNLNTSYVFNITIADAISSSGRIKIDFPTSVKPSWSSVNCANVSGTNTTSTPTCALSFNSLILTSLNATSSTIGAQTITITVYGVINPGSTEPSGGFTVTTYYSTTDDTTVATGIMGNITSTAATINSNSISIIPSSYVVSASAVSYTLSFVTGNAIPINGFIVLGIPTAITTNVNSIANSCLASTGITGPVSTVCTGVQSGSSYIINFTQIFQSSGVTANTTINLRVAGIFTNPLSTLPVSSFSVETHSATGYLIEQLSTGLSITMTIPAIFTNAAISAVSSVNSATTEYTFTLSQQSTLASSSFLDIIFPAQISPRSNSTCKDATTNISVTCTLTSKTVVVTLPATATSSSFGVKVNNIINGPSLKPSGKFGFRTRTPDGNGKYSEDLASVTFTNTVPSLFPAINGTFSPQTLESSLLAKISFTPTSQITGYAILNLASSFTVLTLNCQSFLAFTGSCSQSNNNTHMVNVTGSFTNGAMSFTVSNLSSGLTVPNDYTVFTTFDALGYIIDQSQNDIIFILACTLPCKTCSGTQTNCTSCYNDTTITSNVFYFASANQCLSTCLDGFYSETVQYTCAPCSATCLTCTITSTNCLTCVLTSLYPYLNKTSATNGTCLAQCDYGMYPDITSTCVLCVDPCKACTNLTTCLSCNSGRYFYQFNCLLSCPANYTIANNSTNNCDACSATCLTCIGSTTNCSSCNAGTALYQGNCIVQCPAPLINKTGVCQPCDSPCATCSLISTNCTSCMPNTTTPHYMSTNNSCLDVCPSTYYNTTAINDCLPCSSLNINCVLCKNATSCLTCDAWFVFFSSNASCLNFTPSGYANISGIAQPCEGDCSTCFQLTTNCTACKTLNLLGNQCIPTCPTTYAPIFGVCTACQLPCATCSQSINNCTSCVSNSTPQVYLSGNQCVVTCPTTTYANSTLQQCVQCVSPCQTCSSQTVCQSCVINFNLYQTSCLDGYCPGGTTPIASVCVNCTSPCLSCSTSASTCTSCIHGLTPEVYLANTICLQASQCPNGTYPDSSNNTCVNCSPPCLTCSSLTSCLSCMADYNLEGTLCKSQCLDGFMPVNSICTACKDPCATCAGSLTTCLTCNYTSGNPLYLSGYRCISTCPETTYPNGTTFTCNPCVSPCSSCSSLSTCNTCMSGYYLYGTYCSSQCPPGYVGIALTCEKCSTGCLSCVNSTFTCTACQASYYMLNLTSQCVQNCPTGLYEDPIQGVCIGCILPCLGCTGTPTNCTICQTGSLYNNSCVPNCPDAYFSYNSVCETCPIGCITCTSLTRCTECDVLYYSLDNACITSCPSQKAIVINKTCTPCTDINCAQCTSGDYCLVCTSPTLLYLGDCTTNCPTNYTSNGTDCVFKPINSPTPPLKQTSSIFPLPFSIATIVVVIMCLISKFQNSHTFASGAIYALIGIFEWGSLIALTILYAINYAIDYIFWIVIGAIIALYVINIFTFGMMLLIYRKDLRFTTWSKRSCSSKTSWVIALCIGLIVNHKYYNILFCRLFNFYAFKASLQSVNKFFWLHLMSLISLVHSIMAVGVASYIIHLTKTTINQTLLCALDVLVVTTLNVLVAGSNAHKDQSFFEEYDGELSLNKKINAEDECNPKSIDHAGEGSERESAYCGRHIFGDPLTSLMSMKVISDKEEESVGEFVIEEESGDQGQQPLDRSDGNLLSSDSRDMADASVQALEILDEPPEMIIIANTQLESVPEQVIIPKTQVQQLIQKIEQASAMKKKKQRTQKTEKAQEIMTQSDKSVRLTPAEQLPVLIEVKRNSRYSEQNHGYPNPPQQHSIQLEPSRLSATVTNKQSEPVIVHDTTSGVNGSTILHQKKPIREVSDEGFEVLNLDIRDSQAIVGDANPKPVRQSSPKRADFDDDISRKHAQHQKNLQRLLREKEQELTKIRKKVQSKEKQRQITLKASVQKPLEMDSTRKMSSRQTSTFTGAAEVQDPLLTSKVLKKEQHLEHPSRKTNYDDLDDSRTKPVRYSNEFEGSRLSLVQKNYKRDTSGLKSSKELRKKLSSDQVPQQDNTMELLNEHDLSQRHEPSELSRLDKTSPEQIRTPFTETIERGMGSARHQPYDDNFNLQDLSSREIQPKIKVENIDIDKSQNRSQEGISTSPPGVKLPARLQQESIKSKNNKQQEKQLSEFSEPRNAMPRVPIILTSSGKTSFIENRSQQRKSLNNDLNDHFEYRTIELKRHDSPTRGNLVYDANALMDSDSVDMDYTGISPSQFNMQNQRLETDSATRGPSIHYGIPSKPQIVQIGNTVQQGHSSIESRELHRRVPIMVGVKTVDSRSLERRQSYAVDDELRDYYEAEKRLPKKQNKSIEKTNVQKHANKKYDRNEKF